MSAKGAGDGETVQRLLEHLLESGGTIEDVCAARPDLIDEVRQRWREVRSIQAEVDDLFPDRVPTIGDDGAPFPQIPGVAAWASYTAPARNGCSATSP